MMPYGQRRKELHESLGADDGVLLFLGGELQPRNYPDNPYMPFRQNSHFLYYVGIQEPGFALLSYPDGQEVLFGPPYDIDVVIWTGMQTSLKAWARRAEAGSAQDLAKLPEALQASKDALLYLPPYQADQTLRLAKWLDVNPDAVVSGASQALQEAVVAQRLHKSEAEVREHEEAINLTREILHAIMQMDLPSLKESDLYGYLLQQVASHQRSLSFNPILTTHGEVLHLHHYGGPLKTGRLLLMDMGTESALGYAADITRTIPVNGVFHPQQRDVYTVALRAQEEAIALLKPGISFRDVHLHAAKVIAAGLCELGLMQGDPEEAVAAGAHALFFPHGLGHMLGIDVHDMEDLGDLVGYGEEARARQFGLNFLRMARQMEEGFIVTVEPGIYFIPTLLDQWRKAQKHAQFICYERLDPYYTFGGIRIEDDVLLTTQGARILGEPIVKAPDAIEEMMAS